MIKFDKVTLEPKFIDPSMCFCGGGGGTGGGGTPTKGTNAINRGTVGMTAAEMNRRADAQERGSRQSAGVAGPSSRQDFSRSPSNFGAMSPEEIASEAMASSSDRFTTSTEAAYRDLDRRADIGQMPNISKGFETPLGRIPTPTSVALGAVNRFGMNRAQDIRDQIRGGGVPVTDRFGRIQGVVSEGTGPVADILGAFGQNRNVYTGGPGFAPSTSQLMSYRPDPTRQGIASLPYADVQMPTTTRVTPLAAQRLSAPEIGSIINVDNRNFLVTEKGPVELKGAPEQETVSPSPLMNSFAPGTQITTPQDYYARETGQLSMPSSSTLSGQDGYPMSRGLFLDQDEMANRRGQIQNVGLYEDLKSGIGNLFGTSPARGSSLSGYYKGGNNARTYYQGPGKDVNRPFKGSETGFGEFFKKINPFN